MEGFHQMYLSELESRTEEFTTSLKNQIDFALHANFNDSGHLVPAQLYTGPFDFLEDLKELLAGEQLSSLQLNDDMQKDFQLYINSLIKWIKVNQYKANRDKGKSNTTTQLHRSSAKIVRRVNQSQSANRKESTQTLKRLGAERSIVMASSLYTHYIQMVNLIQEKEQILNNRFDKILGIFISGRNKSALEYINPLLRSFNLIIERLKCEVVHMVEIQRLFEQVKSFKVRLLEVSLRNLLNKEQIESSSCSESQFLLYVWSDYLLLDDHLKNSIRIDIFNDKNHFSQLMCFHIHQFEELSHAVRRCCEKYHIVNLFLMHMLNDTRETMERLLSLSKNMTTRITSALKNCTELIDQTMEQSFNVIKKHLKYLKMVPSNFRKQLTSINMDLTKAFYQKDLHRTRALISQLNSIYRFILRRLEKSNAKKGRIQNAKRKLHLCLRRTVYGSLLVNAA